MVTNVFVAKVNRIVNDKTNNYYIHRINIPSDVVRELNLGKEDYLLFKAKKAEWYDMLDWSEMETTWNKLPLEIKNKIKEDGIFDGSDQFKSARKQVDDLDKINFVNSTAPSSMKELLSVSTSTVGIVPPILQG